MKYRIKEDLFKLQDKKYQEFHSKLCPGTDNIIGIRIPVLREYAKKLLKENDFKTLINYIDDEYYEEIMLQGMLIGLAKSNFNEIKPYIENFIPKIDNWAICDTFCAGLKITKKNQEEMWNLINKYVISDKEFCIRFAGVMILDYYIDEKYLEEDFKIFNNVKSNKYYVQMAVAWAISICFVKYFDKTIKYMKTANLDDFTYNKAIQKAIESYRITKEEKEILRKMKR